jgi:hypothetical protein
MRNSFANLFGQLILGHFRDELALIFQTAGRRTWPTAYRKNCSN